MSKRTQRTNEAQRQQIALDYIANRDHQIDRLAREAAATTRASYEEAKAVISGEWALKEQQEGIHNKVRSLYYGYDEERVIQSVNAKLNGQRVSGNRAARRRRGR